MSLWRKDLPVLDDARQIVKGGMWPHQRQWWESTAFIKALVTGYGGGKAQPLDSPVLTPLGWKRIGDLKPGDFVLSPSTGKRTLVTSIHPQGLKEVFKVSFSNKSSTLCCDEHLWNVKQLSSKKWQTVSLSYIRSNLTFLPKFKTPRWKIPTTHPLHFEQQPIQNDPQLVGKILCQEGWKIPTEYLYNTIAIRLSLLQGFMLQDGAGLVNKAYSCTVGNSLIQKDLTFLIESLGGIVYKCDSPSSPLEGYNCVTLFFTFPCKLFCSKPQLVTTKDIPVFERKIESVVSVGMQECVCISVSEQDGLYLTDRCIVTHNTLSGSKWAIAMALHNAPSPFACVSPSYKMAKRTLIPTIKSLLEGKSRLDRKLSYRYHKTEFEFTVKYGNKEGIIWVVSGDDPESLKGPNLGACLIDEPFIQDREVFDQMIARVRDPNAKLRQMGLTGTPEDLNWGYDICEGEESDNFDIDIIQASTAANLALDPNYTLRLQKAFTTEAAQAYVEGKFVSLSTGLVYYGFSDANVIDLPDPGHELRVGMDFNVDPMAAIVYWVNGPHMHIVDEIELPNADTQQMCSYLHELYPERIRIVTPDASGKSRRSNAPGGKTDYHYIEEAGFAIYGPNSNPAIRDRYNAVNGKLKPMEGRPTLTISPKCKKLKKYMKQYSHEKILKQKEMSHLLDALGYPVSYYFPVKPRSYTTPIIGF